MMFKLTAATSGSQAKHHNYKPQNVFISLLIIWLTIVCLSSATGTTNASPSSSSLSTGSQLESSILSGDNDISRASISNKRSGQHQSATNINSIISSSKMPSSSDTTNLDGEDGNSATMGANEDDAIIRYLSTFPSSSSSYVANLAESVRRQLNSNSNSNSNINSNINRNYNDNDQQQSSDTARLWQYIPLARLIQQQRRRFQPQQLTPIYGNEQRFDDHTIYEQLEASKQLPTASAKAIGDLMNLAEQSDRDNNNELDDATSQAVTVTPITTYLASNAGQRSQPFRNGGGNFFGPNTSSRYPYGIGANGQEFLSSLSSKRAERPMGYHPGFGLGKRPMAIVKYGETPSSASSPVGKRPSGHRYDFGLGKRAGPQYSPVTQYQRYDFGLGKRVPANKVRYDFGLGK